MANVRITCAGWTIIAPRATARGSVSHRNYSWTSVSPVALLLEGVLGLEPDAIRRRLVWRPWPGKAYGVNHYPLGPCTVSLHIAPLDEFRKVIHINTNLSFTLSHRPLVFRCQTGDFYSLGYLCRGGGQ